MIERSLLLPHAFVGQRLQESHQRILVRLAQVDEDQVSLQIGDVDVAEIALAIVEIDNLPEFGLSAVVEEGTGQLHMPEIRDLEGAVYLHPRGTVATGTWCARHDRIGWQQKVQIRIQRLPRK